MPTTKAADRVGGVCGQQRFKNGVSVDWDILMGEAEPNREQRGLTESQEERRPVQSIKEYSPLRK